MVSGDANGFRGLTSSTLTLCNRADASFKPGGFVMRSVNADGKDTYTTIDSPVVCFESARSDNLGKHAAVMDGNVSGYFPPNTLYRLKRVELNGFTAPNGVFVNQPLHVVVATYRPPRAGSVGGDVGRYLPPPTTLRYGDRAAFVDALQGRRPPTPPISDPHFGAVQNADARARVRA